MFLLPPFTIQRPDKVSMPPFRADIHATAAALNDAPAAGFDAIGEYIITFQPVYATVNQQSDVLNQVIKHVAPIAGFSLTVDTPTPCR